MCGLYVAEPVDAGGCERDVGVEAAGDGAVDDGLAKFVQEGDALLLGVDVTLDAAVDVVKVAGDGGLASQRGGRGTSTYLIASCVRRLRVTPLAGYVNPTKRHLGSVRTKKIRTN